MSYLFKRNDDMFDIFKYAVSKKKTVVIIANTYMSESYLTEVITEDLGIIGFKKLYGIMYVEDLQMEKARITLYNKILKE